MDHGLEIVRIGSSDIGTDQNPWSLAFHLLVAALNKCGKKQDSCQEKACHNFQFFPQDHLFGMVIGATNDKYIKRKQTQDMKNKRKCLSLLNKNGHRAIAWHLKNIP